MFIYEHMKVSRMNESTIVEKVLKSFLFIKKSRAQCVGGQVPTCSADSVVAAKRMTPTREAHS